MSKKQQITQCKTCESSFPVHPEDQAFYDRLQVPSPTLCPDCRQQRRQARNNEMHLYHRNCDFTGEKIISIYSTDKPYKVYKPEAWWSDEWDAIEYGRSFDFSRPFFEQYDELIHAVPHVAVQTNYLLDENSDYTNYAGSNKDCYLIFHADFNRDCFYGYGVKKNTNVVDVFNIFDSELCYQCIDCFNCYNGRYMQNCMNCNDSYFLKDCIGCTDCIGCKNLRQKQYYIFNEKHTKDQYEAFLRENDLSSRAVLDGLQGQFEKLCLSLPNRHIWMLQTEGSFGDQLHNCRNVRDSFDVSEMRDGRYCYQLYNGANDCMDLYQFGLKAELVYEGTIIGYNAHTVRFSHSCHEQINDLTYCQHCHHAKELFGCFGLSRKQYCILNKQYSKDEYETLVPKIIAHMQETAEWGEFFPAAISPFGYNETTAQLFYPMTKDDALAKGYKWDEEDAGSRYQGQVHQIPDTIAEVDDDLTKAILQCQVSGKPYKVIPQELAYYRKMNIPIPTHCFEQRHLERMEMRNPRVLRDTHCATCNSEIKTSQRVDHPSPILCEPCYQECML